MLTRLTCLAVLALAGTASADSAVDRTRSDAQRVWYHDSMLTVAQRDLATAQLQVAFTRAYWDAAVEGDNAKRAGYWATRHWSALQARKDALGRVMLHRAEHELARADFNHDAAEVRAEAVIAQRARR